MEKDFHNWTKNDALPQIRKLISEENLSTNIPQQNAFTLYSLYSQEKLFEKTKWLVWATWAVAIATILLLIFK